MEQCVEYTKQTLPQAQLFGGAHGMGSEDFGSISQACTANYMMIGAATGPLNECFGQHNSHVRFDENALPMSCALYASVAANWLADKQNPDASLKELGQKIAPYRFKWMGSRNVGLSLFVQKGPRTWHNATLPYGVTLSAGV